MKVLPTGGRVRKRSDREGLPIQDAKGKNLTIEPLSQALAKKGVYNLLVQKQVTAWADLRNKAAHAQVPLRQTAAHRGPRAA